MRCLIEIHISEVPEGAKIIGSRYLFKVKQTSQGLVDKLKTRLIAQGYRQCEGIDYAVFEAFAPVVRYATLRIMLAVAAAYDLILWQMDVKTAYLNGDLPEGEEVYLRPPKGYKCKPGTILKLKKGLYGLKTSGALWNKNLHKFLIRIGFKRTTCDACMYTRIHGDEYTIVCIYVDDITIASNRQKYIDQLRKSFKQKYKMDDKGELEWILGMRVTRNRHKRTIHLDQERYILDSLKRFNMDDPLKEPPIDTPADPNVTLSKAMCPKNSLEEKEMAKKPYARLVGTLLYAVISTRPDIANAVRQVSRYMANPGKQHWKAARRILRYLKGTPKLGITFSGNRNSIDISCYADAAFAPCIDTRRSTTAFVVYWNNAPVTWESRTQPTVAKSTTESEYMAMAEATSELLWQLSVARDLQIGVYGPITLFEDNQGAIALANTRKHMRRTKHIDIRYHFVREIREKGLVDFVFCETKEMIADALTKSLPRPAFRRLRAMLLGHAPKPAYERLTSSSKDEFH